MSSLSATAAGIGFVICSTTHVQQPLYGAQLDSRQGALNSCACNCLAVHCMLGAVGRATSAPRSNISVYVRHRHAWWWHAFLRPAVGWEMNQLQRCAKHDDCSRHNCVFLGNIKRTLLLPALFFLRYAVLFTCAPLHFLRVMME
jgi:hypothetical protein